MDPLGLAASVAGLLSLCIQLSTIIHNQVVDVVEAPSRALEFQKELELLVDVLKELTPFLERNPESEHGSTLDSVVQNCQKELLKLKDRVAGLKTGSKTERMWWFYNGDGVTKRVLVVHRYLATAMSVHGL
jgi:hypothetical protein